jgi:hypothetical protein
MAQKLVTTYIDDLTGDETEEIHTYTILVNGAGVEIDLSPDSYDTLLRILGPFLNAHGARRVRGATKAKVDTRESANPSDVAAIRAWARENGYEVNERGRIPKVVREAYMKKKLAR